jgi:streptomycin 6-kinase
LGVPETPEPFPLPGNLVEIAEQLGNMDEWLAALPALVAELAGHWSLDVGAPFQPGGRTAWVAPATDQHGTPVVLKVGFRHPEGEAEAAGLRVWAGAGAVRLLDEWRADATVALLLERCEPGTALSDRPEPEQDEAIASVLRPLWIDPPAGHGFPSLAASCREGADAAAARFTDHAPPLAAALVDEGLELLRTLPATSDQDVLLVTDLHAGNVLAARRAPWLVIDPKPHVGDPHVDAVQHLLSCRRLRDDPLALVRRLARLLDLDPRRVQAWTFARCVQEADRWDGLAEVARRLRPG